MIVASYTMNLLRLLLVQKLATIKTTLTIGLRGKIQCSFLMSKPFFPVPSLFSRSSSTHLRDLLITITQKADGSKVLRP